MLDADPGTSSPTTAVDILSTSTPLPLLTSDRFSPCHSSELALTELFQTVDTPLSLSRSTTQLSPMILTSSMEPDQTSRETLISDLTSSSPTPTLIGKEASKLVQIKPLSSFPRLPHLLRLMMTPLSNAKVLPALSGSQSPAPRSQPPLPPSSRWPPDSFRLAQESSLTTSKLVSPALRAAMERSLEPSPLLSLLSSQSSLSDERWMTSPSSPESWRIDMFEF